MLADLPLYTSLTRYLAFPKIQSRYLQKVVMAEVLDTIPYTEGDVDIVWQLKKKGSRQEGYAVAVPRKAMDAHVRLLRGANIRPAALYSRANVLALAAGVPDAIVVHFEASRLGVVLVHEGLPRVVHEAEFPKAKDRPQELAGLTAMAVNQVAGYYQTLDTHGDGHPFPVVLTGQVPGGADLAEILPRILDREVLPCSPGLVFPGHFPDHEYAANLGLALADRANASGIRSLSRRQRPSASLSLLPKRHLPRSLPMRPAAAFLALALFATLTFNIANRVDAVKSDRDVLTPQLTNLETQDRQDRPSQARARVLHERVAAAAARVAAVQAHRSGLREGAATLLAQLRAVNRESLPPGVLVSALSLKGTDLTAQGTAASYEDVVRYAVNLRASGLFSDLRVPRITASGVGEASDTGAGYAGSVDFHLTASAVALPGG